MIEVRPAKAEDAQAIWKINEEALGYSYPLEKTKEKLAVLLHQPSQGLFVAWQGEQVVGYVHAADYECSYFDSLKNILALAVLPAFQKSGAGRLLMQAAEQWAKNTGSTGIRLSSGENRTGAHVFYQKCGYTMRKQQKNFFKALS